jgi:hypothetical protein
MSNTTTPTGATITNDSTAGWFVAVLVTVLMCSFAWWGVNQNTDNRFNSLRESIITTVDSSQKLDVKVDKTPGELHATVTGAFSVKVNVVDGGRTEVLVRGPKGEEVAITSEPASSLPQPAAVRFDNLSPAEQRTLTCAVAERLRDVYLATGSGLRTSAVFDRAC